MLSRVFGSNDFWKRGESLPLKLLCLTLPVLNEESRLEDGVLRLMNFIRVHELSVRVDIADNGSTDQTAVIARRLIGQFESLTFTQLGERGVGRALNASWDRSQEAYVGYMDVDLSTDLSHLIEVFALLQRADFDVINGSRLLPSSVVKGRKWTRALCSHALNWILRRSLQVKVTDAMCGFKFIRRESYQKLRKNGLGLDGWFFNAELLIRAEWTGLKICELPVIWQDDPRSKVKMWRLSLEYLGQIFELWRERRRRTQ